MKHFNIEEITRFYVGWFILNIWKHKTSTIRAFSKQKENDCASFKWLTSIAFPADSL